MKPLPPAEEQTGVDDVRHAREVIAKQHNGDLAAHIAETNRIVEDLRARLALGPVVQPPRRDDRRSGTGG